MSNISDNLFKTLKRHIEMMTEAAIADHVRARHHAYGGWPTITDLEESEKQLKDAIEALAGNRTNKPEHLYETAKALLRLVESNRNVNEEYRDHTGRLKDTPQWVAFYSATLRYNNDPQKEE